ncbi:MAG: EAL domain-containing protein [Hyphomicrobiales bacterium]|nr:EAL domain-containing protein [Hyphomicrobiales bacterium]
MDFRFLRSTASGREERTLFPVAIVTCLVLVGALLSVYVARNSANSREAQAESAAVEAAIDDAKSALGASAEALAADLSVAAASAHLPQPLASASGAAWLVDLSSDSIKTPVGAPAALFTALKPAAQDIAGADALRGPLTGAQTSAWAAARTLTAVGDGKAWLVAIVPTASTRAPRAAVVTARPVDELLLAELARAARTERIDFAPVAVGGGQGDVALRGADGQTLDLVWRLARPGDAIVDNNAFFLLAFAALFAALVVFHSKRVTEEAFAGEERARAQAGQDPMTGLPNRILFMKLLEAEIHRVKRTASERGAAVLLFDVDRLGAVNATSGEAFGDRLVVELSRRIGGLLRASGRLARLDGDEFAVLQTDITGPRDVEKLARRIVESLAEPIDIDGNKTYVSVSIGIALCPLDSSDAESLLQHASLALYRAKNEGRNGYAFFEARIGDKLKLQKAVEDDLRTAIENDLLEMRYQPVMEGSGKRMVGVEALVRWPHPTHGTISPVNFIAMAEESGLIEPLGEWVLQRALMDARSWPGMRIAVNVSGIQLRNPGFVIMLEGMLKRFDIDAGRLELEVTENILLSDADAAEEAMVQVRAMGVRLALDDFGTGYSSLIYLRRFAFDKIKIDKSFLDAMEATGESAIIVHSIVHLGRALGLTVTAEGVETPDQLRFLQALACHELQGYLFSKPVPAAEITKLLEQQNGAQPDGSRAVA